VSEFGPEPQLTSEDLYGVLTRNLDSAWLGALLEDPSSKAIFEGLVAALLRCQDAVDHNFEGDFILTAPAAGPASSTVRLWRANGSAGTLPTTLRFRDQRGAVWRPTAAFDYESSGGPQTIDVPIRTDRAGYWLNSFEPLTYQFLDQPPDAGFLIQTGEDAAEGGTSPFLEQLGHERGVGRAPGESADQYRLRVSSLVDRVSPVALAEAVLQTLEAYPATSGFATLIQRWGLRVIREPVPDSGQPAVDGLGSAEIGFLDDLYLDDHAQALRALEDSVQEFDLELPSLPLQPDTAMVFWDAPDESTIGVFTPADFYFDDGFMDLGSDDASVMPIAALMDEVARRKAAGVRVVLRVGNLAWLTRHPPSIDRGGSASVGSWDPTGADDVFAATAEHDGDNSYVSTTTGGGVSDDAQDPDLAFVFPAPPAPLEVDHVRLVCWARRVAAGGDAPVLRFIIKPPTSGAGIRVGRGWTIDHEDWRRYEEILDVNPGVAAWELADLAGDFLAGVANAADGTTDEIRVSELLLTFVVSYG